MTSNYVKLRQLFLIQLIKLPGLDKITMRLIKKHLDILAPILCNIFNYYPCAATYPSHLKTAKVVPVYKEGDRSIHPATGQFQCSHIFEKIIVCRMHKFLKILCPQQHGFRPKHSTTSAVLSLTINLALDRNQIIIVMFGDLKKSFWHGRSRYLKTTAFWITGPDLWNQVT